MADNVTLNSGSGGAVLATDDVGGVHYQIVKLAYGALDAADIVSDSNPLPVDDAGGSLTVDNAHLTSLGGAVAGTEVQVDVVAALPAGDNNIGNVDIASAIPAGTNNIGDVDVLSVVPGTGATSLGKEEDAAHSSADTGVMALAVRRDADTTLVDTTGDYAPLQVDANGYLKVEIFDGGGSHTVDGTVTANAGTDLNTSALALESGGNLAGAATSLAILDDWDESDRAKVNPIVGQAGVQGGSGAVSATTQRVCLATDVALPAGTNNIGDVDVLSIAAGTNLIGNVGIGVRTSGGATPVQFLDVDETEDEVKGSAGQLYFIHAMNLANAKRYLKVYDGTAAGITVGSDTPKFTFTLPTQGDTNGAGFTVCFPMGIAFASGITIAATTGFAVADTGAPGANEVIVNVAYA